MIKVQRLRRRIASAENACCDLVLDTRVISELLDRMEAAEREADNWKETAAQYARNEDFYRGIVYQIGELFGEEARTSDDGSVQDDVLALKVPELVEALAKRLNDEDLSHSNTMEQRDFAETMADNLSAAIMGITGRDIGEHSSANCPWSNAFEHAEEYESERDALAAHVERLRDTAKRYFNATCGEPTVNIESPIKCKIDEANAAIEALESAIKSTPTTSLARLKAQWQAEALDKEADGFERDVADSDTCTERLMYKRVVRNLRTAASELRRQAERNTNE